MTPDELRLKEVYEEIFSRWPMFKRHVHARVGLAEPLAADDWQQYRKDIENDPEIVEMLARAALGLRGKKAGMELTTWLQANGIMHGPLADTHREILELESELRASPTKQREAAIQEKLHQLRRETEVAAKMAASRINQAFIRLNEMAPDK